MSALDDLAAALGMNPLDFVIQNLPLTGRLEKIYREELEIADGLMGWRQRWHPRGDAGPGPVKRGLGLSLHTWGGRGHRSNCEVTIHPDGTAEAKIATPGHRHRHPHGDRHRARRDARPAARRRQGPASATAAIRPPAARAAAPRWAASARPPAGRRTNAARPGSSRRRRRAWRPSPRSWRRSEGTIRVKGDPREPDLAAGRWPSSARRRSPPPAPIPGPGELTSSGVGGVQMADVSVDIETGVVKINKMVAVQDCGLIST